MRKKTFNSWLTLFIFRMRLMGAAPVPLPAPYNTIYKAPVQVGEECIGNEAGEYPCAEVDLKGFFSASNIVGSTTKKLSE